MVWGLIVNIKLSTSDKSCMVSSWKFAAMIFRLTDIKKKIRSMILLVA